MGFLDKAKAAANDLAAKADGALSNAGGQVRLAWEIVGQDTPDATLRMLWEETDGPPVAPPERDDREPGVAGAAGADFGQILSQGIENLQNVHDRADTLAVQAATGDLNAIHDYTITATEAAVSTQLTTAVRNKALEAFQEIMRMSI